MHRIIQTSNKDYSTQSRSPGKFFFHYSKISNAAKTAPENSIYKARKQEQIKHKIVSE